MNKEALLVSLWSQGFPSCDNPLSLYRVDMGSPWARQSGRVIPARASGCAYYDLLPCVRNSLAFLGNAPSLFLKLACENKRKILHQSFLPWKSLTPHYQGHTGVRGRDLVSDFQGAESLMCWYPAEASCFAQ